MNRIAVLGTGDAPVPDAPVPEPILAAAETTRPELVDVPGAVVPASPEAAALCATAYLQTGLEAERAGLDPNEWFENVEVLVAREVGPEPVRYVKNIFKYYVAYTLDVRYYELRTRTKEEVGRRDD